MNNVGKNESLFRDLMQQSIEQRFGIRQKTETRHKELKPDETMDILIMHGLKPTEQDESWIQFERGNPRKKEWADLPEIERQAIENNLPFPLKLTSRFKIICVGSDYGELLSKLEMVAELLEGYGQPVLAKVAKPGNELTYIVIYSQGLIRTLDLALNIAHKFKSKMDSKIDPIDKAMEVVEGSGVFLTQGTYSNKKLADSIGASNRYTPDGALFADIQKAAEEYIVRRKNQIVIEENLYLFLEGPPSERLIKLQMAAFDGLEDLINLGLRETGACVRNVTKSLEEDPGYVAPRAEAVGELLNMMDKRYEELMNSLPQGGVRFSQAARIASFLYMTSILIHPLEDGNGQSARNLATIALYELGMSRIYLPSYSKYVDEYCTALDLAVTSEAPKLCRTKALDPKEERKLEIKARQTHSYKLILAALDKHWNVVREYIRNGGEVEEVIGRYDLTEEDKSYLLSYLKRLNQIAEYIKDHASKEPFGSVDLTYSELSELEDAYKF